MTDFHADWVHVVPGPGELKETAKALLTIAPDPSHVRTWANGTEFLVHPAVAETYNKGSAPAPKKRAPRKKTEAAPVDPFADETEGTDHAD